ncbi:MAG TPA: ATP-binding protein [Herpetosiphonaceae bacterium]
MQIADLTVQIQEMQRRLADLQQGSGADTQQEAIAEQALEDLQISLEELRVVEEALIEQNMLLLAAQEELTAERQRYQELFDGAPDGYVLTTPSGIIQEANQAASRLLNMSRAELQGKPLPLFVAEADRQQFRSRLHELRAADRIEDREVSFHAWRGESFIGGLSATPVRDRSGHLTALRWSIRDVTAQRQAEEQIRRLNAALALRVAERTAELEAANRQQDQLLRRAEDALKTRDMFLTIASHELKTPLTSLIGYVYLLQQTLERRQEPHADEQAALQVIMQQSQRLNQLIEMMLDLAHLQHDEIPIARWRLDLADVARQVVARLRPTLSRHTIRLTVHAEPLPVLGDIRRLCQALEHVLQNAVKYSPHSGSIDVQLGQQGSDAWIQVRDDGIGIPQAAQAHIFDRFYRADNFNHLQISGFGIGLYLAREMIAMHSGRIAVTSSPGEGSSFDIYLPLAALP